MTGVVREMPGLVAETILSQSVVLICHIDLGNRIIRYNRPLGRMYCVDEGFIPSILW
jgi:hypothetical protein